MTEKVFTRNTTPVMCFYPEKPASATPVRDNLVVKLEALLSKEEGKTPGHLFRESNDFEHYRIGQCDRSWVRCYPCDLREGVLYSLIKGPDGTPYVFRQFAVHNLEWHRDEVPEQDIRALEALLSL